LDQKEGDFRKNPNAKTIIAQSTAEMVGIAVTSFKALGTPRYHEDFLKALDYTTAKIPKLTS
ncbi:MAG: hypothetical protein K2X39_09060, partial [Silvanigrellaceae bacterium]|nr:hypothetical protein [Silvanigrellaceae bacterium]